jgi:hypothetical protein
MPTLSAETGKYTRFKFPGSKIIHNNVFIFYDESPSLPDANQFIKKNNGKLINHEDGVAVYQEFKIIPFAENNKTVYGVYYRYICKRRQKPKGE